MSCQEVEIAIVGAGIIGVATAFSLTTISPQAKIALIDRSPPMSLTSAQSGENYRNWWPHPIMTGLTDRSIDLLEQFETTPGSPLNMSRRGYILAARKPDLDRILAELRFGYSKSLHGEIRVHEGRNSGSYIPHGIVGSADDQTGVDVLVGRKLIGEHFPLLDPAVQLIVHVRRAGDVDSHQLSSLMLARLRANGNEVLRERVQSVCLSGPGMFCLEMESGNKLLAEKFVNAAGPFAQEIAGMLGEHLPVSNLLQQKLAFEDAAGIIPRDLPFCIDLDPQHIDWSDEERQLLAADRNTEGWTHKMPGAIHCRPDGGLNGTWIKLGWAYNQTPSEPLWAPQTVEGFHEIVLRGAARLNPALKAYYGKLPRNRRQYGGYYTMTEENWPLIGPMGTQGAYINGAHSGFGTMAACAAGELCAKWVLERELPEYAAPLSLSRYQDAALMTELRRMSSRGVL